MTDDLDTPAWPEWAEPLRPDAPVRRRIRMAVLSHAESLFRIRRESWQDVASGWAAMLIPIAAVLLILFAGLAYQATAERGAPTSVAATTAPAAVTPSYEELMAGGDDQPPVLLTGADEPSRDALFTAVMRSAATRGPGGR